jgi:hypothetical protein
MGALAWKVIGTGSAVVAAAVTQKGLTAAWRAVRGNEPPTIPEDPDTGWGDAIAWAVLSGAALGVARLLATRKAAAYYRKSSGELPKALIREA